jgi:hypothetical protein
VDNIKKQNTLPFKNMSYKCQQDRKDVLKEGKYCSKIRFVNNNNNNISLFPLFNNSSLQNNKIKNKNLNNKRKDEEQHCTDDD